MREQVAVLDDDSFESAEKDRPSRIEALRDDDVVGFLRDMEMFHDVDFALEPASKQYPLPVFGEDSRFRRDEIGDFVEAQIEYLPLFRMPTPTTSGTSFISV